MVQRSTLSIVVVIIVISVLVVVGCFMVIFLIEVFWIEAIGVAMVVVFIGVKLIVRSEVGGRVGQIVIGIVDSVGVWSDA